MNATMTLTPEAREDLLCYLVTTVGRRTASRKIGELITG